MTTNQTIDGVPGLRDLLMQLLPLAAMSPTAPYREMSALLDAPARDYVLINGMHFSHAEILEWREKACAEMEKAAQPQGEPVAEVYRGPVSGISRIRWIDYKTAPVGTKLYAEQPAPVAVDRPVHATPPPGTEPCGTHHDNDGLDEMRKS